MELKEIIKPYLKELDLNKVERVFRVCTEEDDVIYLVIEDEVSNLPEV